MYLKGDKQLGEVTALHISTWFVLQNLAVGLFALAVFVRNYKLPAWAKTAEAEDTAGYKQIPW